MSVRLDRPDLNKNKRPRSPEAPNSPLGPMGMGEISFNPLILFSLSTDKRDNMDPGGSVYFFLSVHFLGCGPPSGRTQERTSLQVLYFRWA
jgi:hypothetical protein